MDIWEWVGETTERLRANGQARLADLIDEIPSACCDAQHERVESMVPEALALARAVKNPWLDVFIRHWLLQSRVLHRHDVSRDTLQQAVSLVELASRPETRDCPQSICAVQDLCSAYGLVDGFGYAEQRLAVTAEALGRIEPSRPCFDCVSAERASALLDSGSYQEALEFCEQQLARRPSSTTGVEGCRFRSLMALGRHRDAAQAAQRINLDASGSSGERTKTLYLCLAEARLGRLEQASKRLPPAQELEPEHFVDWLRCVRALGAGADRPNDWRIERAIATMREVFRAQESYFTLAKVHKVAAELAVQRKSRFSAERHLAFAREAASQLVKSDGIAAKLRAVALQVEQLPAPPLATSADAVKARLGGDPEQDLALLAASGFADDVQLVRRRAAALEALGARSEAQHLLETAVSSWPSEVELMLQLLETLLDRGQHERIQELCSRALGEARAPAQWVLARSFSARGELNAARSQCELLLAAHPQHHDARHMLAELLRDQGELDASLEHLDALVAAHDPGDFDWDRALVATLAGRWDAVREAALRLELPVNEGERGPIDERWGACRIRFRLQGGRDRAFFAWRSGPVTARVDEVVEPGEEQHHGDLVVFDAAALNQDELEAHEEAGDDAGRAPLCEYAAFRVLQPGGYRAFDLDGFAPSPETLATLKQRLDQIGVTWEQRSGDQYQLTEDGEHKPAVFAFLGLPASCSDSDAHQVLLAATAQLALRLVWPKLADAAGDGETASQQRRLADDWGIE